MTKTRFTRQDLIFNTANNTILTLVLFVILLPIINIVSRSFSSTDAVIAGRVWLWPVEFSLKGYRAVFKNPQIWLGYVNSIFYTAVGTAINLFLTLTAAGLVQGFMMMGLSPWIDIVRASVPFWLTRTITGLAIIAGHGCLIWNMVATVYSARTVKHVDMDYEPTSSTSRSRRAFRRPIAALGSVTWNDSASSFWWPGSGFSCWPSW